MKPASMLRPSGLAGMRSAYHLILQQEGTSVQVVPETERLKIYPVPAKDVIYVAHDTPANGAVRILDNAGRLVMETESRPERLIQEIPVGPLPPGLYFLRAGNEYGRFQKL